MAWPGITEYSEAIQNPRLCFNGAEFEAGTVATNQLGMPLVWSGNFACVYNVSVGGRTYAVRCFTREVKDQQTRYNKLSRYLNRVSDPSFVHFEYVERGINLKGTWYPIVRMEWVEGESLSSFVESNLDDPDTLRRLAAQWREGPAASLRGLDIAHNDLQHGNVMVQADGRIRLVDYDGMFLPDFQRQRSPETGHKNFQHPRRTADDYDAYVDNFPSLVVYLSLLAIASDTGLWGDYHNQDNLVFTRDDYRNPGRSPLFDRLHQSPDQTVSSLAERLEECCALSVKDVPDLETILQGIPASQAPSPSAAATPAAPSPTPASTAPAPSPSRPQAQPTSGLSYRDMLLTGQTSAPSPTATAQPPVAPAQPRAPGPGAVDRDVLAALYNATGGPSWKNNKNWLSAGTLGTWYGVTADGAGRVISLELDDNKLRGQIPAELGHLSNLAWLNLRDNQLRGQIPAELGHLSKLEYLDLMLNKLSGKIPPEISNLSKLTDLRLHDNQLRGQIPAELGHLSKLDTLALSSNKLSGKIPAELGHLSKLERLALHDNQLSGQIPAELGHLSNLESLVLHDNQLRGQIPPELGNLSNLEGLSLSNNQLRGCMPPALRNVEHNDFDRLGLPFCEGFFHQMQYH